MAVASNILPPRYRAPKLIARGGMGEIYRTTDEVLGRQVAVKVLAERYAADESIGARFTREAQAAARLSGRPNIVMIYDVGEWVGRPFIVMQYLAGGSLAERIAHEGAQPPERAVAWLEQAAAALDVAHRNGIVHRDVKPANVLVGPDGRARLTDFGIAQAEDSTGLTDTGQVIGTLKYLAPEVARGEPATPRSDLYSLGVLLSEVAAGDRSPSLARLIDRLMAADPSHRPSSAAQALSALNGATGATAPTRPLGTHAHHSRVLVAMSAAAALAAVIVLIVIVSSGGGGKSSAATVRAAPANAPLGQQLNTLDRMVDRVSGR
jgi:eukaryotic-like serine/threonine-protein kinase